MRLIQTSSRKWTQPRRSTLSLGCDWVRTAFLRSVRCRVQTIAIGSQGIHYQFIWRSILCLVLMHGIAVSANLDVSSSGSTSAGATVAAVNARQLLEQAPQTEYALNALKVELGPRRDKLISMQRDLKAHLEQFKHTSENLTDADRDAAHEALNAETQAFQRRAQEFQDDANSKRDRELDKVRKFITHEIESYAANNGYKAIAQYEGPVPHGELDLTKKIRAILLEKPKQLPASEAPEPN